MKSHVAVYPGTFDPVTYGHRDLIRRALEIFPRVVVGVAEMTGKETLFSVEERVQMLRQATREWKGVRVEPFGGLAVSFARRHGSRVILRGLRMISDFEYEFQIALTNRRLAEDIETVFLMPSEHYSFLSSTLLKEVAALGADISSFVPALIERRLKERLKK